MKSSTHISRFKGGAKDIIPQEGDLSWSKLYTHLTTARLSGNGKLSVPAFSFAEYGPVKRRRNENVAWMHGLSYDIDNRILGSGNPGTRYQNLLYPEDLYFLGPINDYAHLHYSTYSSTSDWPRFRVVLPLKRRVTPEEYVRLYALVAKHLSIHTDMDPHADPSRIFFEFQSPNIASAFSGGRVDGPFLDPDNFLEREAVQLAKSLDQSSSASMPSKKVEWLGGATAFENYALNQGENDLDKIKACLTVLDPDCRREEWLRTGMGIHHETQGSDEGFALWHKWSEGGLSTYAGLQDCQTRWDSFTQNRGIPTTLGSVVLQVRKVDPSWSYMPPAVEDFAPNTLNFAFFGLDYMETQPPPINWLVEGYLNAKVPTMFTGVGNAGKSFLMMELALCLSHQLPFYGHAVPQAHTVFYLNGEDSQYKFKRRVLSWNERQGEGGLELQPGRISYHGPENISPRLTRKTLDHYVSAINRTNPTHPVLIIDPLRRFALGSIKEDEDASAYRALTSELCHRIGGTVIDVHHETKVRNIEQASESRQGGHVGLGSTALFDLARQAFTLRLANADEALSMGLMDVSDTVARTGHVVLEHAKADEGEINRNIYLKRGVGGVLSQIDVAEVALDRVDEAKGFYPVGVREEEARAEFVARLRRLPPRMRSLRDDSYARDKYMGEKWNTVGRLAEWLSYGEMAGFFQIKKRVGLCIL